jgi:hypothetical protein
MKPLTKDMTDSGVLPFLCSGKPNRIQKPWSKQNLEVSLLTAYDRIKEGLKGGYDRRGWKEGRSDDIITGSSKILTQRNKTKQISYFLYASDSSLNILLFLLFDDMPYYFD